MAFRFSFAHLLCTLTLTMFRCLYYRSSLEPRRLRPISHKPCPALSLWSEPHFLSPHRRRIGSVAAAATTKNDLRPGVAGRCRPVNEGRASSRISLPFDWLCFTGRASKASQAARQGGCYFLRSALSVVPFGQTGAQEITS